MIETWRQCYTAAHITKPETRVAYLALGAFRGGGYIKELRLTVSLGHAGWVRLNMVVSGTGQESTEAFLSGGRIIETSNIDEPKMGRPWELSASEFWPVRVVIPMWRRVDSGSKWILIAVRPGDIFEVSILATVTVVGLAKIGVNGLGVKDGLDR